MACENKVSYFIPRGYDYRVAVVPCGRTDPQGYRALCFSCRKNAKKMQEVERLEANIDADNAWAASAGRGEY